MKFGYLDIKGLVDGLTKAEVGLSNVDNKSEATIITDVKADTDVASAISLKHEAATAGDGISVGVSGTPQEIINTDKGSTAVAAHKDLTTGVHGVGSGDTIAKFSDITKGNVGLGNVDNVQQLPMSYLDTDNTLANDSDSKVASQKAVKHYIDTQAAGETKKSRATFVNGDLAAGVLTITHSWGLVTNFSVQVVILDNTDKVVVPDEITCLTNTTTVDLTSYGVLTGTWKYLILG